MATARSDHIDLAQSDCGIACPRCARSCLCDRIPMRRHLLFSCLFLIHAAGATATARLAKCGLERAVHLLTQGKLSIGQIAALRLCRSGLFRPCLPPPAWRVTTSVAPGGMRLGCSAWVPIARAMSYSAAGDVPTIADPGIAMHRDQRWTGSGVSLRP